MPTKKRRLVCRPFVGSIKNLTERRKYVKKACPHSSVHAGARTYVYLRLLCRAAKDNGFDAIYDDIAVDNPAIDLFLSEGFVQVSETKMIRLLRKDLRSMQ